MTHCDFSLHGSLSRYAAWAGISLDTAKKRLRSGTIIFSAKYPHMVDFIRSSAAARRPGRPLRKKYWPRRINWTVDAEEYDELLEIHKKHIAKRRM